MLKVDRLKQLRHINKLTIEDISHKLNVNKNIIIDWENGKKCPSIKQIKKLAKIYKVDYIELIDENMLLDKAVNLKKIDNIQSIILFILLVILLIFISLFLNRDKYKEEIVYKFSGKGDIFSFENGIVVFTENNKFINISGFKTNEDIDIKSLTINIAFNESIWAVKDYDSENISVKDWLSKVRFYEYGSKNHLFESKKQDSFVKYDVNFPKDFKVEVNYCTKDECSVDILDISADILKPDNALNK